MRMVAYKGGQAAGMEMPNRLVSARNAIHLLPRPLLSTVQEVDETPLTEARIIQLQSEGLCQVHTQGFIDNLRAELESGDARAVASFTAFSSLLTITDQVLAACPLRVGAACPGCAAGLALVRPAGHHSLPDEAGCLCAFNSVLAVAAREADKGKTVGVLDVDVHYARGSQQIAMERNRRRGVGQGRVLVADVYAAAGPPATYVQEVQNHHRRCKETLDAAALRTEMDEEFAGKQHRQAEMNDPVKAMVCESFLFFPFDPQELTDEALLESTTQSIRHFKEQGVDLLLVSLGLDAARGDREGAQITPDGYKRMAAALRRSGLHLVFALEGGYDVGELDVAHELSRDAGIDIAGAPGVEEHFLGTGSFGKCVREIALALVE